MCYKQIVNVGGGIKKQLKVIPIAVRYQQKIYDTVRQKYANMCRRCEDDLRRGIPNWRGMAKGPIFPQTPASSIALYWQNDIFASQNSDKIYLPPTEECLM